MDQSLYSGDTLYDWIQKRADALKKVIEQKEKELAQYPVNLPQGKIKASCDGKNHTREQYYLREQPGEKTGKYIKKVPENQKLIKMMIQREYDQKLLRAARDEYKYLLGGRRFRTGDCFSRAYDSLGGLKQKWVLPALMSDEEYEREWRSKPFAVSQYKKENKNYKTKQGEEVRSKSELIIANALFERDIPYRYECPLTEYGRTWAVPDFTVLNVRKRKEYFWEHFGMMGNADYAGNALKKIRNYEKHHMYPGSEMIYTFESSEVQMNVETIEEMLEKYFEK